MTHLPYERTLRPVPDRRVGDAERDAICAELATHYGAGRLTADEVDERLAAALNARTGVELVGLIRDLPAPPRGAPAPPPARWWTTLDALVLMVGSLASLCFVGLMLLLGATGQGGGEFVCLMLGGLGGAAGVGGFVHLLHRRAAAQGTPEPR